jgi:DedD protein
LKGIYKYFLREYMERRTTQRIIGILVVAALIVISLPLLFGGSSSEVSVQSAEVKAPPFPDQEAHNSLTITQSTADTINPAPATVSMQVEHPQNLADATTSSQPVAAANPTVVSATAMPDKVATPEVAASTSTSDLHSTMASSTTTAAATQPVVESPTTVTPQTTVASFLSTNASSHPVVADKSDAAKPEVVTPEQAISAQSASALKIAVPNTTVEDLDDAVNAEAVSVKPSTPKHVKVAQNDQDVNKLKSAAWVVQMGSFKNKTNALRLANQLRAMGYKAFTQNRGNSMRVYVGPEFQQASANSLATKIQQRINLQGIIVSYKPLEI